MRSPRPSVSACVAPVWCPSGVSRQSLETVWKLRTSSISWSREPAQNGQKDTLFGASRYRQTRDPTRPATFQTVSRETVWKILSTSQPSYHEPCHRDIDKRFSGGAQPLVVLAHPPVLREPREGALHNPAAREDLEAPARKQLLPIDLPALFRPLLRPHHRNLLWRRLGSAMDDLDTQA